MMGNSLPSSEHLERVKLMAELLVRGTEVALDMLACNELTFNPWTGRIRSELNFPSEFTSYTRLEWVWDYLRNDPDLHCIFGDMTPADSVWNHSQPPAKVLDAGEWFCIGLDQEKATLLLFNGQADLMSTVPKVTLLEDLLMRPGKRDRLECCDCRCEVTMHVDEVYEQQREADITCVPSDRIRCKDRLVIVQADSLNQAYTIASRRLQPKRRSHVGRVYDHLIHIHNDHRVRLEDVRLAVEHGIWKTPRERTGASGTSALSYDHNAKSGNEGDVVKHAALVAAIFGLFEQTGLDSLIYADTYAAYSWNTLTKLGEWRNGIGKLGSRASGNKDVAWWIDKFHLDSVAAGAKYPGSSVIASEVCKSLSRNVVLHLWDLADGPVQSLRETFPEPNKVRQEAAQAYDPLIIQANLILIDPPDKSHWDTILTFIKNRPNYQSLLVWLPINANTSEKPPIEDRKSATCREQSIDLGLDVTKVRWAKGGRTIGCQLVYALPSSVATRVRNAVDSVFGQMRWGSELGTDGVVKVEHFISAKPAFKELNDE